MKLRLPVNPLVIRFARTGLRRGKGSFHVGVTAVVFVLLVLVNLSIWLFRESFPGNNPPYPDISTCARYLYWQILGFHFLQLFFLGMFRIYGVVIQERKEETLEFLRVSTMSPFTVTSGFILGLQLPGYLFVVAASPLVILCWLSGGIDLPTLVGSHLVLFSSSLLASLYVLHLAVRLEKRSADAVLGILIVALLFGTGMLFNMGRVSGLVYQLNATLHPLALCMGLAGSKLFASEVVFFGWRVPPVWPGVLTHLLLAGFVGQSVIRHLRWGERHRVSLPGALLLMTCFVAGAHALVPPGIPGMPNPELPVARAATIGLATVLSFYLAAGRLWHGELWLLARTDDSREQRGPWVIGTPLSALAPLVLIAWASDIAFSLRGDGAADLIVGPAAAALLITTLVGTAAVELGTEREPGPARKGLFWALTLTPALVALLAAALSARVETTLAILAASPVAFPVLLTLRDLEKVADALPAIFAVAATLHGLMLAVCWKAGSGHYRILSRQAARMREGPPPQALEGEGATQSG